MSGCRYVWKATHPMYIDTWLKHELSENPEKRPNSRILWIFGVYQGSTSTHACRPATTNIRVTWAGHIVAITPRIAHAQSSTIHTLYLVRTLERRHTLALAFIKCVADHITVLEAHLARFLIEP